MRGFVVLVAFIGLAGAAKLPDNFKRCKISDPNFDDCLKANVEDAIRKLVTGAPTIGLKPLDPLDISQLTIGQGSGPVNVQQNFKNVKLYGLTKSKILSYRANLENYKLYTESISPELRLEAQYDMKGRILLLPIQGNGPCNITLINAWLNHTLIGEPYEKKGKKYWRLTDYRVTILPERMTFKFDNLFNGDNRLGDEINKVLNENWDAIYNDVRRSYEESFGLIFKDLANRVFNRVPFNELFIE